MMLCSRIFSSLIKYRMTINAFSWRYTHVLPVSLNPLTRYQFTSDNQDNAETQDNILETLMKNLKGLENDSETKAKELTDLHYQIAEEYMKEDNYDEAFNNYMKAEEYASNTEENNEGLFKIYIGFIKLCSMRGRQGEKSFRSCIDSYFNLAQKLYNSPSNEIQKTNRLVELALTLVELGAYNKAKSIAFEARKFYIGTGNPSNDDLLNCDEILFRCSLRDGDRLNAAKYLKSCVKLLEASNPSKEVLLYFVENCLYIASQVEDSQPLFFLMQADEIITKNSSYDEDPLFIEVLLDLAKFLNSTRQYDLGLQKCYQIEKILELKEHEPEVKFNLATLFADSLMNLRKHNEAINYLKTSISLLPSEFKGQETEFILYTQLFLNYLQLGNFEGSLESVEKAIETMPKSDNRRETIVNLLILKAVAYLGLGESKNDEMVLTLTNALEILKRQSQPEQIGFRVWIYRDFHHILRNAEINAYSGIVLLLAIDIAKRIPKALGFVVSDLLNVIAFLTYEGGGLDITIKKLEDSIQLMQKELPDLDEKYHRVLKLYENTNSRHEKLWLTLLEKHEANSLSYKKLKVVSLFSKVGYMIYRQKNTHGGLYCFEYCRKILEELEGNEVELLLGSTYIGIHFFYAMKRFFHLSIKNLEQSLRFLKRDEKDNIYLAFVHFKLAESYRGILDIDSWRANMDESKKYLELAAKMKGKTKGDKLPGKIKSAVTREESKVKILCNINIRISLYNKRKCIVK